MLFILNLLSLDNYQNRINYIFSGGVIPSSPSPFLRLMETDSTSSKRADLRASSLRVVPFRWAVFAIFAGWYYWFSKMTGYEYSEFLGKLHFWLTFIGVNLIFFPQHFLGLAGMPRRYADYPDAFAGWNYISSIGSYISIIGLAVFLLNLLYAFMKKKKAEPNPWGEGATTLEWTVSSPPPFHTFEELPKVK